MSVWLYATLNTGIEHVKEVSGFRLAEDNLSEKIHKRVEKTEFWHIVEN